MTRNMTILHFYTEICHLWAHAACCSEEISLKSKVNVFHKSVKYSYFWSFSGYAEENKMFWKLNFTAHMMIFHQLEPSVG